MKFIKYEERLEESPKEIEKLTAENKKLKAENEQLKATVEYTAMMSDIDLGDK